LQSPHLIEVAVPTGEHDDRNIRAASDLTQYLEAIFPGQPDIQQDDVWLRLLEIDQAGLTVWGRDDYTVVPLKLEAKRQGVDDEGVIVYDENLHAAALMGRDGFSRRGV